MQALPKLSNLCLDTDGLIAKLDISPEALIKKYPHIFDTSGTYTSTHTLYHTRLKFCPGSWKIELPHIHRFVGLKSKIYSVELYDKRTINRAKGVATVSLNSIDFDLYIICLKECSRYESAYNAIRSNKQTSTTISQTKSVIICIGLKAQNLCTGHNKLSTILLT